MHEDKNVAMSAEYDPVTCPAHYVVAGGIEPLDFIMSQGLDFARGNVIKYVTRAGRKGGPDTELEDLHKAAYYLKREIERVEGLTSTTREG